MHLIGPKQRKKQAGLAFLNISISAQKNVPKPNLRKTLERKSWASTQKPDFGDFEGLSFMTFLKAIGLKIDMRPLYRLSSDHVKIQPSTLMKKHFSRHLKIPISAFFRK